MYVVKTKGVSVAKAKFKARTEIAGPDYETGVKSPRINWDEGYEQAWERIKEGLREALEHNTPLGGVKRKGHAFWSARVLRKGVSRWKEETPKAADTYAAEVADFFSVLESLTLEKKRKKGDLANVDGRVKPIVKALHEKKLQLRGYTTAT
jgi:hypothetical protein